MRRFEAGAQAIEVRSYPVVCQGHEISPPARWIRMIHVPDAKFDRPACISCMSTENRDDLRAKRMTDSSAGGSGDRRPRDPLAANRSVRHSWARTGRPTEGSRPRGERIETPRGGKEVHASDVARAVELLLQVDAKRIVGQSFSCCDMYVAEEILSGTQRRRRRTTNALPSRSAAPASRRDAVAEQQLGRHLDPRAPAPATSPAAASRRLRRICEDRHLVLPEEPLSA